MALNNLKVIDKNGQRHELTETTKSAIRAILMEKTTTPRNRHATK